MFEDVVGEMADLGTEVDLGHGLAAAIRSGLDTFWTRLVTGDAGSHLMQTELVAHAVRRPGDADLARWLYDGYLQVATDLCREAATRAGESSALPHDQLARLLVAGLDGLLVQHLTHPDDARARADLDVLASMLAHAPPAAP